MSLPRYNNSYDSLLKGTLFVANAVLHPFIGIENTGTLNTTTYLGLTGRLTINLPATSPLVTNTLMEHNVILDGYDGTTDYGGNSGRLWEHAYSLETNSKVMNTAPELTPYIGTGNINFATEAKSMSTTAGGGNLDFIVETEIAAGLCITYEYLATVFLPVSIKNISASTDGSRSFIKWTTASEYQNKGFAIERSNNGTNFTEIGFAESLAHDGTSTTELKYDFTDEHPVAHTNYYRLKQSDRDGKSVYSKTLSVNITTKNAPVVTPNPAHDYVTVNAAKEDKVIISDFSGKILNAQVTDKEDHKVIQVKDLPDGNYYLKITTVSGAETSKFTVLH